MTARMLVVAAMTLATTNAGCAPAAHVRARPVPVVYAEPPSDAITALASQVGAGATDRRSDAALEPRGIPRFAEIEPGLARGGQPTAEGLRFLRDRGYRTVINFRGNSKERRVLEGMGIRYVQIPLRAGLFGASPPSQEDVARFLSVVSDSSQRPVFIHCKRGKDRTGAMAAIYRIEARGWGNEEAIREMLSFGFDRRYRKLMNYVRDYAPISVARRQREPVPFE